MNKAPLFHALDVFFYKGFSLRSRAVRVLTSIRYGVPFRKCLSHVAVGYDSRSTISAEATGAKIILNSEIENSKSDVVVYRFVNLSRVNITSFREVLEQKLGIKYAYARYGLDAARIFSFVSGVLGLLFGWISLKMALGFVALLVLLQVASHLLRKVDNRTSDCAELTAMILGDLRLLSYLPNPRNEFPNSQLSKMETLEWHGLASKINVWNYKSKTWREDTNGK